MIPGVFFCKCIQLEGGDSCPNVRPQEVHELSVETSGSAQSFLFFRQKIERKSRLLAKGDQSSHKMAFSSLHSDCPTPVGQVKIE